MFNIQVLKKGRKYVDDSLFRDLISYWKLNEGSGTRVDSVGDNDLTDNNTVTRVLGKQSGAAAFASASSEFLRVTSNSSLNIANSPFTICGWVNFSTLAATAGIITKSNASTERAYEIQYNLTANRIRFLLNSSAIDASSLGTPSTATWYFVCVWYDGTNINIQVNNGTVDSTTGAWTNDYTQPLVIGGFNGSLYLNGSVDEVGFWKRVLTSDERARLYNAGDGTTYPFNPPLNRLVSYWAMEQTSGTRTDSNLANDLTDNNTVGYTNGVIRNGALFALANSESLNAPSATLFNFGDGNFSIATWVYLNTEATSQLIAAKYASDTDRDYLLQYVTGSDFFSFIVYNGALTSIGLVTSSAGINTGQWYFVVAYHDATNNLVGISVNGGAFTTAATTGAAGNGSGLFYLGNSQGGATQYLDGRLDEVGVWNKVLSSDETTYLYNQGRGKTYPFSPPMSSV